MDYFVEQSEERVYRCSGFWGQQESFLRREERQELFRGRLGFCSLGRVNKWRNCSLTSEFLYVYSEKSTQAAACKCKKFTPIRWKCVSPFIEQSEAECRYGFRLSRGPQHCDFYTESESCLEEWLEHLSAVAVMTDCAEDYEVLRELGKGAHSSVRLARATGNSQLVAIKTVSKEVLSKNTVLAKALVDEVNLMTRLPHQQIVKLLGVYESETELHLILEYVGGGDILRRLKTKGRFSEAQAAIAIHSLLETLKFIHSRGVVHRDIKPENILLAADGNALKLADFGLATDTWECDFLTQRCGSPGYVAPEILSNLEYGEKVDIFGVGIVLYAM